MDGYALVDIPRSGVENMALDQRMLEYAVEKQCPMLRVYQWSEPTASLGYFQKYADFEGHFPNSSIAVVRRATGGGAIVHDHDWTYCVAIPNSLLSGKSTAIGASQPLYDCLHDGVIKWLSEKGLSARKWAKDCQASSADGNPASKIFLCFQRRSCGDIIAGDYKVMGSAQRRIHGGLLQHGSLLLRKSQSTPSLLGISDLRSQDSCPGAEPKALGAGDRKAGLGLSWEPSDLRTFFQRLIESLESLVGMELRMLGSLSEVPMDWTWPNQTRFADPQWTRGK